MGTKPTTLFDLITPANIAYYWDSTKANQQLYMGETLFPVKKQAGIRLSKISGRDGLPVELKPSAFDTQATYRDRLALEVREEKMPFYRERMKIDEETRQQIVQLLAGQNGEMLKSYVNRIFDDTNNLIRGARVARERMAMELISTGKITIRGNGVDMVYDYGLSNRQFKTVSTSWSDTTNANPLQDIQDMLNEFNKDFGVRIGYAVMNTTTFNYILHNEKIKAQIYPTASATALSSMFIAAPRIRQLVSDLLGITIIINDNVYATNVGGIGNKFFPDDVVTFLPIGGRLGNMVFGTTPEELDLLSNAKFNGTTRIVDTGVAVTTLTYPHPVNVETIVSQICLPSFGADVEGGAGSILIAKVKV